MTFSGFSRSGYPMIASNAVAPAWAALTALPRAREDGKGGYYVSCPTDRHQYGDRSAGLHVTMTDGGTVLIRCHAGCDHRDILRAVGYTPKDLYPDTPERRRAQRRASRAIGASPNPHLVALRNAEYEACLQGWRDACHEVSEVVVDSIARQWSEYEEVVI